MKPRPVVDDDQIGRPLLSERLDQLAGNPGIAEPTDHNGGAIKHARYRFATGRESLVDHDVFPEMTNGGT